MPGPLEGLRVVDLSRLLPGPFLTGLLADLGADVVKIEAPGVGDETRWIPPEVDGAGYAFAAVNRGKRSLVVDLKRPGGAEIVLRLAARADVLVEGFRPGVMARLGLSDESLVAHNPRLVRCSLVGYPAGEYRADVGHDLNYQSLAGILAVGGAPAVPPTQVADLGGALYAATGILAALHERARTGVGRRVEVALADAAVAFNVLPLARAAAGEDATGGWELTGRLPCYRLYACADGRHVALAALEPKFFERFADATGVDAGLQLDRSPEAHATLEALFAKRAAHEWIASLRAAGVPITPVLSSAEVGIAPAPGFPLVRAPARAPPALGEHTIEILREAGYSPADLERLRADAAIG